MCVSMKYHLCSISQLRQQHNSLATLCKVILVLSFNVAILVLRLKQIIVRPKRDAELQTIECTRTILQSVSHSHLSR
jgi:hypothetical protein